MILLVDLYINRGRRYHQAMSDLNSNLIPITCYGASRALGISPKWASQAAIFGGTRTDFYFLPFRISVLESKEYPLAMTVVSILEHSFLGVVNKVPDLSNGIMLRMLGRYVRLTIKECKDGQGGLDTGQWQTSSFWESLLQQPHHPVHPIQQQQSSKTEQFIHNPILGGQKVK